MGEHKVTRKETPLQRSKIMSSVKSRGNASTELKMLALLRVNKLSGWRRHTDIAGKPDFSWPDKKVALFVDGCFWHRCPRCFRKPKNNDAYWRDKIESNRKRDLQVNRRLRLAGWTVVRAWEHEFKNGPAVAKKVERALNAHSR